MHPTGTFTFQYHFADGSTRIATRGLTGPIATPSSPSHTGTSTTNFLWVGCNEDGDNPECTATLVADAVATPPESAAVHYQVKAHAAGNLNDGGADDPDVKIRLGSEGAFGTALAHPQPGEFTVAAGPPTLGVLYGPSGGAFELNETWDVRHTFARISSTPTVTWTSANTGVRLLEIEFRRSGEDHGRAVLRRVTGAAVSVPVPAALDLELWDDLEIRIREFAGGHVSARPVAPWWTVGP